MPGIISPKPKKLPDRQSRHYFDLAKLCEKGFDEKALAQLDLLEMVAKHKSIFFKSPASKYEEAMSGTLRILPPQSRVKQLEADYANMRQMIFGEVPPFKDILKKLENLEWKINKK